MASNDRIKGITIELNGDTTGLSDALKDTNKKIRSTQDQLRDVEKLLKLDPTNTELLAQKQRLLAEQIGGTKSKLDVLKDAEAQVQKQMQEGKASQEQYDALQREIASTENSLRDFGDESEKTGSATHSLKQTISEQEKSLSELKSRYADIVLEQGKNSKEALQLKEQYGKLSSELAGNQKKLEDAEHGIKDLGDESEKSSGKLDGLKTAAAAVGATMAAAGAAVVAAGAATIAAGKELANLTVDASEYADTVLTDSTVTGIATDKLQEYMYAAELVDVSTETLTKSMAKNIKSMKNAADGSAEYAEAYKRLGVEATDVNGNLRDSDEVYWELIESLGNVENETERDALAMTLLGKSAQELNPLIEAGSDRMLELGAQAREAGYVLSDDTLNAYGSLNDQLQYLDVGTTAAKNALGAILMPVLTELAGDGVDLLSQFTSGVLNADGDISKIADVIGSLLPEVIGKIAEYIPELLSIVGKAISSIGKTISANLPKIMNAAGKIMSTLIGGMTQALPQIMQVVLQLIATLANGITENLPSLLDAAAQIIASLIDGIANTLPTMIPTIVQILVQICQTLIGNLPLILDAALQLIMGLAQGLLDALPVLLDALPEIINGIITFILDSIPEIIQAGIDLLTSIVDALPEIIDTIVAVLPEIITGIIDALLASIPELVQAGIDLLTALITDLPTIIATVVAAIPEIIAGIVSAIGDKFGDIVSAGKDLITQLGKGILEKVDFIKSKIRMLWNSMKAQFEESFGKIVDIGVNLVKGLWDGIKNTYEWIRDKISGFVDDVLGWFKDLFGINSPSKETAWFGEMLGAGLANGIADSAAEAVKAAGQMASDVLDAAQIDLPDVSGTVSANGSYGSIIPDFAAISGTTLPSGTGLTSTYQNAQFDAINVYVDGSHVENVEILADLVADRLNEAILSKMAVFA